MHVHNGEGLCDYYKYYLLCHNNMKRWDLAAKPLPDSIYPDSPESQRRYLQNEQEQDGRGLMFN